MVLLSREEKQHSTFSLMEEDDYQKKTKTKKIR